MGVAALVPFTSPRSVARRKSVVAYQMAVAWTFAIVLKPAALVRWLRATSQNALAPRCACQIQWFDPSFLLFWCQGLEDRILSQPFRTHCIFFVLEDQKQKK